jgi:hypothetical protein
MYSAVISYHTNPYTCGVARFNKSLAASLGVEVVSLDSYLSRRTDSKVMLSIKLEEIGGDVLRRLSSVLDAGHLNYDYFLHAVDGSDLEQKLCIGADRLFAGSLELVTQIRHVRPDVLHVFAPGAAVAPRPVEADCTLLTFGMAHKIRSEGYRKLGSIFTGDSRSFRLEISTALHEGSSFDSDFFTVGEEIAAAFLGSVRFLGFLADDEVSERLTRVDALVAFFPRGVRENNTTVLSAMTHGCPVVTNLDELSPRWMRHGETVFDIAELNSFPQKDELQRVGEEGRRVASQFTFERLAKILTQS